MIVAKPKLVVADVASGSSGAVYTAPATVSADYGAGYAAAEIKHISVCNSNASAAVTVTLTVEGKNLLSGYSIPPSGTFDWEGTLPLGASGEIAALGSTADLDILLGVVEFI